MCICFHKLLSLPKIFLSPPQPYNWFLLISQDSTQFPNPHKNFLWPLKLRMINLSEVALNLSTSFALPSNCPNPYCHNFSPRPLQTSLNWIYCFHIVFSHSHLLYILFPKWSFQIMSPILHPYILVAFHSLYALG